MFKMTAHLRTCTATIFKATAETQEKVADLIAAACEWSARDGRALVVTVHNTKTGEVFSQVINA